MRKSGHWTLQLFIGWRRTPPSLRRTTWPPESLSRCLGPGAFFKFQVFGAGAHTHTHTHTTRPDNLLFQARYRRNSDRKPGVCLQMCLLVALQKQEPPMQTIGATQGALKWKVWNATVTVPSCRGHGGMQRLTGIGVCFSCSRRCVVLCCRLYNTRRGKSRVKL